MNRLVLALAAVIPLLGTGCGSSDCRSRDVDVSWNAGFDGPDNVAGRTCVQAHVQYVDVWMDGQQVVGPLSGGHFPCGDYGATVGGVPSGTRQLTVEGLDAGENIVYRDSLQFSASGCGAMGVGTAPGAGYVDLQYQFFDGATPVTATCAAGSYLWLAIYDQVARAPAVLSDQNSAPTAYSCGGPFTLPLANGAYTLQWMEERGPSPYPLDSSDCTDRPFQIASAATVPVPVDLNITSPQVCAR